MNDDPKGLDNSRSTLVEVLACQRTGDKPLSEPTMVYVTDEYVSPGSTSKKINWNIKSVSR